MTQTFTWRSFAEAMRAEAEQRIAPDLLDFGRRHGLETWVKEVFLSAFSEGVKYANSGRGWRTFAEALPEEGQAIVAVTGLGTVASVYRVSSGCLTVQQYNANSPVKFNTHYVMAANEAADYALWAPLPEGFRLWGEE